MPLVGLSLSGAFLYVLGGLINEVGVNHTLGEGWSWSCSVADQNLDFSLLVNIELVTIHFGLKLSRLPLVCVD